MSLSDPFRSRFEVFGRNPKHVVDTINQEALSELQHLLDLEEGGDGRVILLRAPRAGYGKTSLLARVAQKFEDTHHFIRINLTGGRSTDATHVLEYVLQALCKVVPGSATLTNLDLLARKLLALGLEPLVGSGEVPCQDREGALKALREQPTETFDFHHERAVTAHWTKSNFEILGPRLAAEVGQVSGASLREASYWVELLFRFSTTAPDNVERARLLFETVFRPDAQSASESAAEERLHGLLALLGTVTRVVLIVDDTEGLSTHPPDALELASFLTNISQACPGSLVLLSVNDDIWETAFLPRMPGGLADRLTEYQITLSPLTDEQAQAIVLARAGEHGETILDKITWGDGDLYARRILKAASDAWKEIAPTLPAIAAPEKAEKEEEKPEESADEKAEDKAPVSTSDADDDEPDSDDSSSGEGGALLGAAAVAGTAAGSAAAAAAGAKSALTAGLASVATPPPLEDVPGFKTPAPEIKESAPEVRSEQKAPAEGENPFTAKTATPPATPDTKLEEKPEVTDEKKASPNEDAPQSPFPPVKPLATAFDSLLETDEEKTAGENEEEDAAAEKKSEAEPQSPFAPVARKTDGEKSDAASPFAGVAEEAPAKSADDAPGPDEPANPFAPVGETPPVDEKSEDDSPEEAARPFAAVGEKPAAEESKDKEEPASPFAPVGDKPFAGKKSDEEPEPEDAAFPFAPVSEKPAAEDEKEDEESSIFKKVIVSKDADKKADEPAPPFAAVGDKPATDEKDDGEGEKDTPPNPIAAVGATPLIDDKKEDQSDSIEPASPFAPVGAKPDADKSDSDLDAATPFAAVGTKPPSDQDSDKTPGDKAPTPFAAVGEKPDLKDEKETEPSADAGDDDSPFAAGAPGLTDSTPSPSDDPSIFAPIEPRTPGDIDPSTLRPLIDPQTTAPGASTSANGGPPPLQPVSTDSADSPFAAIGSAPAALNPLTGEKLDDPGKPTGPPPFTPVSSTPEDSPFSKPAASAFSPVGTPPASDEPKAGQKATSDEPVPSPPDSPFSGGAPAPPTGDAETTPKPFGGADSGSSFGPPSPDLPSDSEARTGPPKALDIPASGFSANPLEGNPLEGNPLDKPEPESAGNGATDSSSPFSKPAEPRPPADDSPSPFSKPADAVTPASGADSPFSKPKPPKAGSPVADALAAFDKPAAEVASPFGKPESDESDVPAADSPFKPIVEAPSAEAPPSPFAAGQPGSPVAWSGLPQPIGSGRTEIPPKRTADTPPAGPAGGATPGPVAGGTPFEASGPPGFTAPPAPAATPSQPQAGPPAGSSAPGAGFPPTDASPSPFGAPDAPAFGDAGAGNGDSTAAGAGETPASDPPPAESFAESPGILGGMGVDEDKVDELLRQFKERYGRD